MWIEPFAREIVKLQGVFLPDSLILPDFRRVFAERCTRKLPTLFYFLTRNLTLGCFLYNSIYGNQAKLIGADNKRVSVPIHHPLSDWRTP